MDDKSVWLSGSRRIETIAKRHQQAIVKNRRLPLKIDLNSDLGEGFGAWTLGDDAAMLDLVSSANVACGFHAGDPQVILTTLRQAAARAVAVGAHVSYPDRVGFGRRPMELSSDELTADVIYQIAALRGMARASGLRLVHVKPHGALYNTMARDMRQADAVIAGIRHIDASLMLMGLAGSAGLQRAADAGLATISEVFADRAYDAEGRLVSRQEPGSVLHDPDTIAARMVRLATTGQIEATDGTALHLVADSICVHGDSPGAVAIARHVREGLMAAGVTLSPCAKSA